MVNVPQVAVPPAQGALASKPMAQCTIPVYLKGKLGSMVYTPNRQGTAVRTCVTPANPKTAAQAASSGRVASTHLRTVRGLPLQAGANGRFLWRAG